MSSPAEFEVTHASDFIRTIFGWGRDVQTVVRAAQGFRQGWIMDGPDRKAKRALALDVIRDSVSGFIKLFTPHAASDNAHRSKL